MFMTRRAIIFNTDGLDYEGIKKILSSYGNVVEEHSIENDEIKAIVFILEMSGFGFKLMLDFNCIEDENGIWWPMASLAEWRKAYEMKKSM